MSISLPVAIIFTLVIIGLIIFRKIRQILRYNKYAGEGESVEERLSDLSSNISSEIGRLSDGTMTPDDKGENYEELLQSSDDKDK